jgi:hypothetical protein
MAARARVLGERTHAALVGGAPAHTSRYAAHYGSYWKEAVMGGCDIVLVDADADCNAEAWCNEHDEFYWSAPTVEECAMRAFFHVHRN